MVAQVELGNRPPPIGQHALWAAAAVPAAALVAQLSLAAHVWLHFGHLPLQYADPEIFELGSGLLSAHGNIAIVVTIAIAPAALVWVTYGLWVGSRQGLGALSRPAGVGGASILLWWALLVAWPSFGRFLGWWLD